MFCSIVAGDEPIALSWHKDGQLLVAAELAGVTVTRVEQDSILSFASVAAQHSGNYSCRARNEGGQADKHSYLQVKGRCQEPLLISHLFVSCTQN